MFSTTETNEMEHADGIVLTTDDPSYVFLAADDDDDSMPLTNSEKQKRYRERMKLQNPEKYEMVKKKNAERNRKQRKIKDYDEAGKAEEREKWRNRKRRQNHNGLVKVIVEENIQMSKETYSSSENVETIVEKAKLAERRKMQQHESTDYEDKINMQKEKIKTLQKKMPLTNAQKQKRYRERMKLQKHEKYEMVKKKNAERNKNRRKIKDYDEAGKAEERGKWRNRKTTQNCNGLLMVVAEKNIEMNEETNVSSENVETIVEKAKLAGRRKIQRQWADESGNYKDKIKMQKTKIKKLRKKRPLTNSEKQKRYRERMKLQNPEKYEMVKKKNAERNRKQRKIKGYDEAGKAEEREKWRNRERRQYNNGLLKVVAIEYIQMREETHSCSKNVETFVQKAKLAGQHKIKRQWADESANYKDKIKMPKKKIKTLQKKENVVVILSNGMVIGEKVFPDNADCQLPSEINEPNDAEISQEPVVCVDGNGDILYVVAQEDSEEQVPSENNLRYMPLEQYAEGQTDTEDRISETVRNLPANEQLDNFTENAGFILSHDTSVAERDLQITGDQIGFEVGESNDNVSKAPGLYVDENGDVYIMAQGSESNAQMPSGDTLYDFPPEQFIEEQVAMQEFKTESLQDPSDGEEMHSAIVDSEASDDEVDVESLADFVQALKCKECQFTTLSKSSLINHHRQCHINQEMLKMECEPSKVLYLCAQCNKQLPSVQACRQHMIQDHQLKLNAASSPQKPASQGCSQEIKKEVTSEADEKSEENLSFSKQMRDYWLQPKTPQEVRMRLCSDRKTVCTVKQCIYRFKSTEAMEAHQACHVEGVPVRYVAYQQSPQATPALPFKCSMCEEKFKTWPACSLHLWRSHSKLVDLLQCPLCTTVKTHSAARMAQHLNHHGQRSHGKEDCSECVQDGASATAAVKDEYNPSQRWYAQKRCEICKKMLANSKVLKKHVQAVHNKIKPFICNVCGHSAARKHMLRLHMRQHTGEKPFACDFCSYRTGDHNTLRKHRMKHTGERPYTCTYCSYSSIQSIALHKHLKNKHPDQPVPPLKQKCQLHRTSAPSV